MRSKFSKYQFNYGSTDYPFNLRYKWMKRHKSSHSLKRNLLENTYFIEMLVNNKGGI